MLAESNEHVSNAADWPCESVIALHPVPAALCGRHISERLARR
jgi:hypothetical protein